MVRWREERERARDDGRRRRNMKPAPSPSFALHTPTHSSYSHSRNRSLSSRRAPPFRPPLSLPPALLSTTNARPLLLFAKRAPFFSLVPNPNPGQSIPMVEAVPNPPVGVGGGATTASGEGDNSSSAAVRVEHLSFCYPLSADPTVRDLSLELPPGSRCLLIGANGAGEWLSVAHLPSEGAHPRARRLPHARTARARPLTGTPQPPLNPFPLPPPPQNLFRQDDAAAAPGRKVHGRPQGHHHPGWRALFRHGESRNRVAPARARRRRRPPPPHAPRPPPPPPKTNPNPQPTNYK